jgi:hypothetical protein
MDFFIYVLQGLVVRLIVEVIKFNYFNKNSANSLNIENKKIGRPRFSGRSGKARFRR